MSIELDANNDGAIDIEKGGTGFAAEANHKFEVFKRFDGDGLVNDAPTPIVSTVAKLKLNATNYVAFYQYSYGVSLTFRDSTGDNIFEIHGYDPELGYPAAILSLRHTTGLTEVHFRNGDDTASLVVRSSSTPGSADYTIATETGTSGGDISISPKGTSKTILKNPNATVPVYANNAAAIAGGLAAGDFYRTGADPDPLMVVH